MKELKEMLDLNKAESPKTEEKGKIFKTINLPLRVEVLPEDESEHVEVGEDGKERRYFIIAVRINPKIAIQIFKERLEEGIERNTKNGQRGLSQQNFNNFLTEYVKWSLLDMAGVTEYPLKE